MFEFLFGEVGIELFDKLVLEHGLHTARKLALRAFTRETVTMLTVARRVHATRELERAGLAAIHVVEHVESHVMTDIARDI